jgi:hypothetical protein
MHSSLVVTMDGLPLGFAAIKFRTRKKFKGSNALKKKINPTRVPIEEKESIRWLTNLRQSTLKDRNIPRNLEVRLQSGGVAATNRRTPCQSDICILHSELEDFLADDAQPSRSRRAWGQAAM